MANPRVRVLRLRVIISVFRDWVVYSGLGGGFRD